MAKQVTYERSAWSDRFNRPAAETLRSELPSIRVKLFDDARRRLLEIANITEVAVWYGDCWKWVLEYRLERSDGPLAVLVPAPNDLQLAVPLDREFLRALSVKRLKRAVRDGIDLASEPFDTRWGVWSLLGAGLVADLQDLIHAKLRHQGRLAG